MKYKYKKAHMRVAEIYAELSYAKRKKVGCVIVRDDRIISIGYNGTPSGWDNECENSTLWKDGKQLSSPILITKPEVLHAETNAIAKLASSTESGTIPTRTVSSRSCWATRGPTGRSTRMKRC